MNCNSEHNNYLTSVWKAKKLYETLFYPIIKELKLTQNEIDVLLFLSNNKTFDTAKDITKYRAISKSLVSKSVDSLIKKGYLSSNIDENDKRCLHLQVEASAEDILIKLHNTQKYFGGIVYHDITKEENEILMEIMGKITHNIVEALEK